MDEWTVIQEIFPSEDKARRVAGIIEITESRLSSQPRGPQYTVETEITAVENGWQLRWRKVLIGYDRGCSGCGSCGGTTAPPAAEAKTGRGKVLEFRRREKPSSERSE